MGCEGTRIAIAAKKIAPQSVEKIEKKQHQCALPYRSFLGRDNDGHDFLDVVHNLEKLKVCGADRLKLIQKRLCQPPYETTPELAANQNHRRNRGLHLSGLDQG